MSISEIGGRDPLTNRIIAAAMKVHTALGPGLLESAYEACLAFELIDLGLQVEQQKPLPLVYREVRLDCGYRLDLLVEDTVVVELKAVEAISNVHRAASALISEALWSSHWPADQLQCRAST